MPTPPKIPTFRFAIAAVAAIGLAASLIAQEGGERFQPQFFPGKIYTYSSETDVVMDLPNQDGGKSSRRVNMQHEARVVTAPRPDAAGVLLDASTQRLQFSVTAGEKAMRYDSADEKTKSSALGQHFEGARMRSVAIELDDAQKIVKSEEKGGGGPATPMPGMPQFGPDELKQLVSGLLQGFPPDAVKPGSQWTQKGKRSLGQFGEMEFEISYRYKGDEAYDGADCAVIEFTGDMKGGVDVANGGASGKLGFEGQKLEGRLVYDKLRRAVRESRQTVDLTIDVPNPDPAAAGAPLRLPMRQQVTVKLLSLQDS